MQEFPLIEEVRPEDWPLLMGWLDLGLRRGVEGRLHSEYPTSLHPGGSARHRVIRDEEGFAAHAMYHVVTADVAGSTVQVGLIGLVYTHARARGKGHARACVEACVAALREEQVPLVALWSDLQGFYESMGFRSAGRESLWAIGPEQAREGMEALSIRGDGLIGADGSSILRVEAARTEDMPHLEGLYAAKPIKVRREPGSLARLAAGPDVQMLVAHGDRRPLAYAAMGRGDDFQSVVHEWAGEGYAVVACLQKWLEDQPLLGLLAGPGEETWIRALRDAGADEHPGDFAWLQLLDANGLVSAITQGVSDLSDVGARQDGSGVALEGSVGTCHLSCHETLRVLFGAKDFDDAELQPLRAALSDREFEALRKELPWPLYLWGFDSI